MSEYIAFNLPALIEMLSLHAQEHTLLLKRKLITDNARISYVKMKIKLIRKAIAFKNLSLSVKI